MNNQPNWLNIEEQLYPEIYISKIIRIQSQSLGGSVAEPISYKTHVLYNSLHREINVTDTLNSMISSFFSAQANYNVFFYDSQFANFRLVGNYPFKDPVLLKGIFIQVQHLIVKIQAIVQQPKVKSKTDKTLKFVLQKVAQWRKLHLQSQKKVTLQEAANIIGISRNTLDDYYFQIKLAEKYGFNFQDNLQQPFQNLRKFVKQNQDKKMKTKQSGVLPTILSKYQSK